MTDTTLHDFFDFDGSPIPRLPGMMRGRCHLAVWDVEWAAANDAAAGEGVFYLKGEPRVYPYTMADIDQFAVHCHRMGNELHRQRPEDEPHSDMYAGDDIKELSDAYYDVRNLMPVAQPPIGFDPFQVKEDATESLGGKDRALAAIDRVLEDEAEEAAIWGGGAEDESELVRYLKQLRKAIAKR